MHKELGEVPPTKFRNARLRRLSTPGPAQKGSPITVIA
jgi:hypothetical protein